MPSRTTPDVLAGTIRTFAAALRAAYRPETTCTASTPTNLILLADKKLNYEEHERQFEQIATDWHCWVQNLEVWRGPGNHMTALKLPDVQILANWLRLKLNSLISIEFGTPEQPAANPSGGKS
jgi:arthrofactin-type cyclic lipopeptide synthetase C